MKTNLCTIILPSGEKCGLEPVEDLGQGIQCKAEVDEKAQQIGGYENSKLAYYAVMGSLAGS